MPRKLSYKQLEKRVNELESKILLAKQTKGSYDSELKYKTLVHNIPGMVYKAYPDWSAEIISGSEDICGYTEEELNSKGENWLSIIHPDDKEKVFSDGYLLTQAKRDIVQIYRIINNMGNIRWIEDRKASLFSEEGEFLGIEGIVYDITDRLQIEDKLREKEYIIESASSVIATASLDGMMTYVNPTFLEIWGFKDVSEIYGRHFQEFWIVKERLEEILDALKNKGRWSSEIKAIKKNGTIFDVQVSAAIVYDKDGNPVSLMSSSVDITDRIAAEIAREKLIEELQDALNEIKTLRGILPICASCKKIRDDKGYWNQIEEYIRARSDAEFSHGLCPDCAKKLYPGFDVGE